MSNKQKNLVVVVGVLTVVFLILITYNNKSLFKSSISQPFFPTLKEPQKESMQALLVGELNLDGRCLKVSENLIVWPYGFSIDSRGNKIKVLNERGKPIAQVGDTIKLSGGQAGTSGSLSGTLSEFINEDCNGPLWIAAKVLSKEK